MKTENKLISGNTIEAVASALSDAQNIVIATHANPEGDAIGSALALLMALETMGKKVCVVNEDDMPYNLTFLPKIDKFLKEIPDDFDFDVAVVEDCGDLERVGTKIEKQIKDSRRPIVNIDHHPTNTNFGNVNFVKPNACAAALIVM